MLLDLSFWICTICRRYSMLPTYLLLMYNGQAIQAEGERMKWIEEWDGTKTVGVGAKKGEGSTG